MTATESIYALIAPAYLDRATQAAKAHRWVEAEADLARYLKLSPHDYRAHLLLAQVHLREGRLAECLASLKDAGREGHDRSENDRMIAWLYAQDRRRHTRLTFVKQVRREWRSQVRVVEVLASDLWTKWSTHLLFSGLIIAIVMLHLYLFQRQLS